MDQDSDKIQTGHTDAPDNQSRSRRTRLRGRRSAASATASKPYETLREQFDAFKAALVGKG